MNAHAPARRRRQARAHAAMGCLIAALGASGAAAQSRIGDLRDFERFQECEGCPELIVIPAGSFEMGSIYGDLAEIPVHRVSLPRFAIGRTEVTFAEWDACVAGGGCDGRTSGDEGWGRGARPAINVSWDDAQLYVAWLNAQVRAEIGVEPYRLPTEAEWEYAARAGSTGAYSFGDDESRLGEFSWYADNSDGGTHPVGAKSSNAFGLHDVYGNAWEWVRDCWRDFYSGAPTDGSAWMEEGGGDCSKAVRRAGSWDDFAWTLRSAFRYGFPRASRNGFIGFRVARTLRR